MFFYSFLKSLLFLFDPEIAHRITINYLKFARFKKPKLYKVLQSEVFGLNFQNPIGIAAGFDKNGEVAHNLINLGFGFSEVGFGHNKSLGSCISMLRKSINLEVLF